VDDDPTEYGDLIRLAAVVDLLVPIAERVDGEIVDEVILAELYELRDRTESALRLLSGYER